MSAPLIALLSVEVLIFIYWGYMWLRMVALLHKRGMQKTGRSIPGPISTLRELKIFLTSSEDIKERKRLITATLIMIAAIAVVAIGIQPDN